MSEELSNEELYREYHHENGLLHVRVQRDSSGRASGQVYREEGSLEGEWTQISDNEIRITTYGLEGDLVAVDVDSFDPQHFLRHF